MAARVAVDQGVGFVAGAGAGALAAGIAVSAGAVGFAPVSIGLAAGVGWSWANERWRISERAGEWMRGFKLGPPPNSDGSNPVWDFLTGNIRMFAPGDMY